MSEPEKKQRKQFRVRSDVHGGFIIRTTIATIAAVHYIIWRFHHQVGQAVDDAMDVINQDYD